MQKSRNKSSLPLFVAHHQRGSEEALMNRCPLSPKSVQSNKTKEEMQQEVREQQK